MLIEAQTHCGTTLSCECIAGGLGGNGGVSTGITVHTSHSVELSRLIRPTYDPRLRSAASTAQYAAARPSSVYLYEGRVARQE